MQRFRKYTVPTLLLLAIATIVVAQQSKVSYSGQSYMGDKKTQSGAISKALFDSLIAQPLYSVDTNGNTYQASDFTFTYAERALYQDSMGYPLVTTDYFSTNSAAGRLDSFWLNHIRERSKPGDTAYFDNIVVIDSVSAKKAFFYTEPIRLVITK